MYYLKESQRVAKKFSKRLMVDGEIYDSYRQAAHHLKISRATLSKYVPTGEFRGMKLTPLPPVLDKAPEVIDNETIKDDKKIYSREGVFF